MLTSQEWEAVYLVIWSPDSVCALWHLAGMLQKHSWPLLHPQQLVCPRFLQPLRWKVSAARLCSQLPSVAQPRPP